MENNLTGRSVLQARLHTTLHVQGIGNMGPAVDANSGKLIGALTLTKAPDGLLIAGKGVEVFVPNGNIVSLQLAPI